MEFYILYTHTNTHKFYIYIYIYIYCVCVCVCVCVCACFKERESYLFGNVREKKTLIYAGQKFRLHAVKFWIMLYYWHHHHHHHAFPWGQIGIGFLSAVIVTHIGHMSSRRYRD
jgi:apolipoprotein N-acyltransferase